MNVCITLSLPIYINIPDLEPNTTLALQAHGTIIVHDSEFRRLACKNLGQVYLYEGLNSLKDSAICNQ